MRMATVKLADIALINPTIVNSSGHNDEPVAFVPMAAVSADLPTVTVSETRLLSSVKNGFSYFQDGDILIAKITPCFENGKIAQAHIKQRHGFGSTEFHVVRPSESHADARYLLHFLRQRSIRLDGERKMTGSAGQKRIPKHFIESLEIPLPPIAEQKRIAAILDKAEELRALRRQALEQLDMLATSVFIEMFGDSIENAKNAQITSLGSHLIFLTSGGRGWAEYYTPEGSRFIRSLDVQVNRISNNDAVYVTPPSNAEAKRTRVVHNDVLLTITGSQIGRVAPVPKYLEGAFISQHVAILRPNPETINPMFLSFFLNMPSGGQRQISKLQYGQTKPGLNFEQISNFKIPIPAVYLQQEFAQRVEEIEQLKTTHRESLQHLDALFDSLRHHAFRGEL